MMIMLRAKLIVRWVDGLGFSFIHPADIHETIFFFAPKSVMDKKNVLTWEKYERGNKVEKVKDAQEQH